MAGRIGGGCGVMRVKVTGTSTARPPRAATPISSGSKSAYNKISLWNGCLRHGHGIDMEPESTARLRDGKVAYRLGLRIPPQLLRQAKATPQIKPRHALQLPFGCDGFPCCP